jgi:phage terminase large subunit
MHVPYNPAKPVSTFWDLGWSDSVAIWFGQKVGFEYHLIDYMEDRQRTVQHYVNELQKRGYVYDIDWLPHDGKNATLASNGKSIEQMMRALGRNVRVQPNLSIAEGINASRTVFTNCYFDRVKCADGLHCLRHYQYEVDPDTGMFGKNPLHNAASHGADAFRGFALSTMDRPVKRGRTREESRVSRSGGSGWMGN